MHFQDILRTHSLCGICFQLFGNAYANKGLVYYYLESMENPLNCTSSVVSFAMVQSKICFAMKTMT